MFTLHDLLIGGDRYGQVQGAGTSGEHFRADQGPGQRRRHLPFDPESSGGVSGPPWLRSSPLAGTVQYGYLSGTGLGLEVGVAVRVLALGFGMGVRV